MSKTTCPHCGTPVDMDERFCHRCGTEIDPDSRERADVSSASNAPELEAEDSGSWHSLRQARGPEEDEMLREVPPLLPSERAIQEVAGLLEPVRLTSDWDEPVEQINAHLPPQFLLNDEQLRRLRRRVDEPPQIRSTLPAMPAPVPSYRVYWLFALLLLGVVIPMLLGKQSRAITIQTWPGVAEAHTALDKGVWNRAGVLIFWAYDPSTAGEMDQVAQPVIRHLSAQGAELTTIALLPGALSTARHLYSIVQQSLRIELDKATDTDTADARPDLLAAKQIFLPGGAASLALVGQLTCPAQERGCTSYQPPATFAQSLHLPTFFQGPLNSTGNSAPCLGENGQATDAQPASPQSTTDCDYVMSVVIAAQAEDVQNWLEVVQPLNHLPVVAVTSAAADPMLRPYVDSGQLQGLVSGFDGAVAYQEIDQQSTSVSEQTSLQRRLTGQLWGHLVLLVVLVWGNLVALSKREIFTL